MSKQALHANMRTLGGIFCFHNFFQTILSIPTRECSAAFGCWSRRATWYADFTVNLWALFFVQQSLSPVCMFPSLILRISVRVLSWNVSWITALFHWWVSGVVKSVTRKLRSALRRKLGGGVAICGSLLRLYSHHQSSKCCPRWLCLGFEVSYTIQRRGSTQVQPT